MSSGVQLRLSLEFGDCEDALNYCGGKWSELYTQLKHNQALKGTAGGDPASMAKELQLLQGNFSRFEINIAGIVEEIVRNPDHILPYHGLAVETCYDQHDQAGLHLLSLAYNVDRSTSVYNWLFNDGAAFASVAPTVKLSCDEWGSSDRVKRIDDYKMRYGLQFGKSSFPPDLWVILGGAPLTETSSQIGGYQWPFDNIREMFEDLDILRARVLAVVGNKPENIGTLATLARLEVAMALGYLPMYVDKAGKIVVADLISSSQRMEAVIVFNNEMGRPEGLTSLLGRVASSGQAPLPLG